MKNMAKKISLVLIMFLTSYAWCKNDQNQLINFEPVFNEEFVKLNKTDDKLDAFILNLAIMEGSNNPDTVNSIGYIGTFSFGYAALKDVGYGHINLDEFKHNPKIFPIEAQKDALIKLLKLNQKRLSNEINQYVGTYINGIEITKAGLLAAAHLAGSTGVKKFLYSNGDYDPADDYGSKLTKYLESFTSYELELLPDF